MKEGWKRKHFNDSRRFCARDRSNSLAICESFRLRPKRSRVSSISAATPRDQFYIGRGMGNTRLSMRMWGYLPSASMDTAPLLWPTCAPKSILQEEWRSVCTGGCGIGLAISGSGKIITWGFTDELGQCFKDCSETHLPLVKVNVVQAAGGWAHFVAVTDKGLICTWGWTGVLPSASFTAVQGAGAFDTGNTCRVYDNRLMQAPCNDGLECSDSRPGMDWEVSEGCVTMVGHYGRDLPSDKSCLGHLSSTKDFESSSPGTRHADPSSVTKFDVLTKCLEQRSRLDTNKATWSTSEMDTGVVVPLSLLSLAPGVIITCVAAGGRHTLALSDAGQVWGWGYCGEGQLGLGLRLHMTSTPQLIHCLETLYQTSYGSSNQKMSHVLKVPNISPKVFGTCVTKIACGGQHSAVATDAGAVLTFGWGLYGQCGQGSTEDQLTPAYVSALGGMKVTGLAAGVWHTMFITDSGDIYGSGGNQFGQLGTGGDNPEMLPTLVDAPILQNEAAAFVSCGARHTAVLTDSGKVFCWGWNKYGQLGVGDTNNRDTPVEVLLGQAVTKSIVCGWWHTLALVDEDL